MLHMLKMNIYPTCILKYNSNHGKKNLFFLNDSRQRRRALPFCQKLSALLRGIMSKHDADFYCFDSLHLFTTKYKLESHKKQCKNLNFRCIGVNSKDT